VEQKRKDMKNTIITVKEHNAIHAGMNMKFQNADGSIKKSGYVVTNGISYHFCKSKKEAIELSKTELDNTHYCETTLDSLINA
jgi:hypothetical protein